MSLQSWEFLTLFLPRPKYPRAFSKNLRDLIARLLCHQKKRLGNSKEGWGAARRHLWFTGYDWDGVWCKQVTPPLKPYVASLPADVDDLITLDLMETPDDAECPEWCPRFPKTIHTWRPGAPEPASPTRAPDPSPGKWRAPADD